MRARELEMYANAQPKEYQHRAAEEVCQLKPILQALQPPDACCLSEHLPFLQKYLHRQPLNTKPASASRQPAIPCRGQCSSPCAS